MPKPKKPVQVTKCPPGRAAGSHFDLHAFWASHPDGYGITKVPEAYPYNKEHERLIRRAEQGKRDKP